MSENISKKEISEGYDKIASQDFMPTKFHRKCVKQMLGRVQTGQCIIDLGCGRGSLLKEIRSQLKPSILLGCDISKQLLLSSQSSEPAAYLSQADIENLPFDASAFDACFMTEVLEHIIEPVQALENIKRCLKPGGHLLITVPNRDWFHFEAYDKKRRRYQPVDDHYYTYLELKGIVEEAGFQIIKLRGAENLYFGGGLPHLLEKLALLLYPRLHRKMKRMLMLVQKPLA